MKNDVRGAALLLLATLSVAVVACDTATDVEATASVAQGAASVVAKNEVTLEAEVKAEAEAEADVRVEADVVIEPASFDLEAVAGLVETGELESAAELEVIINDEERGYNRIDIDGDGTIDHVQVVEIDVDAEAEVTGDVVLELRAVPSSASSAEGAIAFATVSFAQHPVNPEVEIRASYTAVVRQPEVRVYTRVVPVEIDAGILVGGSVFLSWVYTVERSAYVGVYVVDERGHWIPPGHAKHGHWKATGSREEMRRVDKGSKKGDGRLVIDVRSGGSSSGSSKIKVSSSTKGSVKSHDSGGGGGKSKSKSKSKGKGS